MQSVVKTRAARETFSSVKLLVRLAIWVVALVLVVRAIGYLQSGALKQELNDTGSLSGASQDAPKSRSAHIIMTGHEPDSPKKDH